MVEQTTFRGAKPNHGKTGSRTKTGSHSRPDILKNPQNLFLLAEARCSQTALHDAIFEVNQVLCSLERAGHDSLPTCMIPDFIDRLSDKIDASEDILTRCQGKLDALVNIYSAYCYDIHQLGAGLSSCKEKFIKMKRRCQHFLPNRNLDIPTVSTLQHTRSPVENPETSPTGLEEQNPTSPPGQWGDSQNTFIVPEDPPNLEPDYSGIQEMFMGEEPSNSEYATSSGLGASRTWAGTPR